MKTAQYDLAVVSLRQSAAFQPAEFARSRSGPRNVSSVQGTNCNPLVGYRKVASASYGRTNGASFSDVEVSCLNVWKSSVDLGSTVYLQRRR